MKRKRKFAIFIDRGLDYYKKKLKKFSAECDQTNIAYLYNADIFSYHVIKRMSLKKLHLLVNEYDFIIITIDIYSLDIVVKLIKAHPKFIFGYSENGTDSYQLLDPVKQTLFFKILNSVDANLIYWEYALSFYSVLTKKPVFYLPFPHSDDYYSVIRETTNKKKKNEKIIIVQEGFSRSNRNGSINILLAKKLIEDGIYNKLKVFIHPSTWYTNKNLLVNWFENELCELPFEIIEKRSRDILKDKLVQLFKLHPKNTITIKNNIEIYKRGNYTKYLEILSNGSLLLELNNRFSIGRNAWDCAGLEIPYISTSFADLSKKIYPYTTIENLWDIKKAYTIAKKLAEDKKFYSKVTRKAYIELSNYTEESFIKRFNIILDNLKL